VQQNFRNPHEHGANLVGNALGGVEMAGVQAQQLAPRGRVTEIKLMRAHYIALRPDAKQLALDGIAI
jgi:hypothetical protein